MFTTLNQIREHGPCESGWKKLLAHLGKTKSDDEPLSITTILDSNGLDDAIWCLQAVKGHDREIRLFGVWCARQVQHLMEEPRSIAALDVAELFANGEATEEELAAASAAGWDAASAAASAAASYAASAAASAAASDAASAAGWDAARVAASAAASDAASAAGWDAARVAASAAASDAASAAGWDAASAAGWAAGWDAGWDAASAAGWDAASAAGWAAARAAQANRLREICAETVKK